MIYFYRRNALTYADINVQDGERLDVPCRWSGMAVGMERPLSSKVVGWEKHLSRAPHYDCKVHSL